MGQTVSNEKKLIMKTTTLSINEKLLTKCFFNDGKETISYEKLFNEIKKANKAEIKLYY